MVADMDDPNGCRWLVCQNNEFYCLLGEKQKVDLDHDCINCDCDNFHLERGE